MAGLLGDIYSYGDTLKRKVNGLLADPRGTLEQFVGQLGDQANQTSDLMNQAGWMPIAKTSATKEQQAMARALLAEQGTNAAMAGATVWHGSPHKFDKFDSGKIGTGEGAQAYGHGLYLAESPEVAKSYANNIMGPKATPENIALKVINSTGDESVAAMRLKQIYPKMTDAEIQSSIGVAKSYQGNTYKVDIPDEHIEKMLDWDKPLSEQSDFIKSAFGLDKFPNASIKDWKGSDAVVNMGANFGNGSSDSAEAAAAFTRKGITGIRYLDGGSRGVGAGTSNYVVFPGNESILKIQERNGQPLGLLGD